VIGPDVLLRSSCVTPLTGRNCNSPGSGPKSSSAGEAYERSIADNALDRRFELYKTSAEREGEVGRRQHGFPSHEEVAL
jgi:hypothetical protein